MGRKHVNLNTGDYKLQALLPNLSAGTAITHPLIGEPIKMDSNGQLWVLHMDGDALAMKTELKMNYFLLVSDKWRIWGK